MPGIIVSGFLFFRTDFSIGAALFFFAVLSGLVWFTAWMARERTRFPLRTVSNLIAGIREGDFSIRARGGRANDALGEVMLEVNALCESLRLVRLESIEATNLLHRVMEEINVAIFTFDDEERLQLVNREGEQLLDVDAGALLKRKAEEVGLRSCLEGSSVQTLETTFGGRMGRFGVRRSNFREDGKPHQLIVVTDLSRTLREEERQAWKRIVRVIGHELNNPLAPIQSISSTLESLVTRDPKPHDWEEDLSGGLKVIRSRAESLGRFMEGYARLARLPAPTKRPMNLRAWIERNATLEMRLAVGVNAGPDIELAADPDQLDQLLINLIRNAVDAATDEHKEDDQSPSVSVTWSANNEELEVTITDNGPGIGESANLFVPFYTTKPGGTGIGLALCRQIAEAHDGSLALENAENGGCVARVRIPIT